MSLKTQLQWGFSLLVLLVLLEGGAAYYAVEIVEERHAAELPDDWDQASLSWRCDRSLIDWSLALRHLSNAKSPEQIVQRTEPMQTHRKALLTCLKSLEAEGSSRPAIDASRNYFATLERVGHTIHQQTRAGLHHNNPPVFRKRWEPVEMLLHQELAGLLTVYRDRALARHVITRDSLESTRDRLLTVIAVVALLTLFVVFRIGRKIGGRLIWISDSVATLMGEEVAPEHVPSVARKVIGKGAHRLPIVETILGAMDHGCLILERGYVVSANREAMAVLGDDLVDQSLTEILDRKGLDDDDVTAFLEAHEDLHFRGNDEHLIFRYQTIDDGLVMITCEDGRHLATLEGHQSAVARALPCAILDSELVIDRSNQAMATLLGLPEEHELRGEALSSLFPEEAAGLLPQQPSTESALAWQGQIRIDENLVIKGTLMPLPQQDGFLFLAQEISEEINPLEKRSGELAEQLDEQAQAADRKAEEAAKGELENRSELIVGLNREVRGPLHSVIGLGQLINDQVGQSNQLYTTVMQLQSQSQRIMETLYDVQDLVQLEAGTLALNPRPAALNTLLEAMVELHRQDAENNGLELEIQADLPEDLVLQFDDLRLRQMINILLSRAMHYSESGPIVLGAEVSPQEAGPWSVTLAVTDSGPSVPEDEYSQSFQLLGSRSKPKAERWGGIDLTVLRLLAEAMGGSTSLDEPEPGRSRFRFSLLAEAAERASEAAAESAPDEEKVGEELQEAFSARVLVVEDDPVNQIVAQGMLEKLGFSVQMTASSEEVRERLAPLRSGEGDGNVDLVLMDLMLGTESGLDITREIRAWEAASEDGQRLPIVAVTARTEAEDRQACLDAGMDAFISKPYKAAELRDAIERLIAQTEVLS